MNNIIAIVGGLIAAIVVIGVFGFVIITIQHNNMCDNWAASIDEWNADYKSMSFIEKAGVDVESHNQDVNAFNKECVYQ